MLTRPLSKARRGELAYRLALGLVLGVLGVMALWNAHAFSHNSGYDALQHKEYAELLVSEGQLPSSDGRTAYYKPPGFYLVGGSIFMLGDWLSFDRFKPMQYLNALFLIATALLVLALARLLWPGRRVLHVAAVAFFGLLPVVPLAAAMYHPATMGAFVSTVALYLAARMLVRRSFGRWSVAGLALALIGGVMVMSSNLWTYGTVLFVFAVAGALRAVPRRSAAAVLAVVLGVTLLGAAPWYVRQAREFSNPIFGDRATEAAPVWERRPRSFYTGTGWPQVLTRPYRPSFTNELLPTTYTGLWGDYFGIWVWGSRTPPDAALRRDLTQQNALGALPTALAIAGLLCIAAACLRRRTLRAEPALMLVAGLPLVALAGYLYYTMSFPTTDGDVLKAMFMLPAAPCWALAFGLVTSWVARRRYLRPALAVVLGGSALLVLRFDVVQSPLGGLF